jgi:hypothetical protein
MNLPNVHVSYRDCNRNDNMLILHPIDSLLPPDYPRYEYEKFAKLTR